MPSVKDEIIKVLKEEGELTAYKIAKKIGASWSTVNYHLLELVADGKVVKRVEKQFGAKKTYYSLATNKS